MTGPATLDLATAAPHAASAEQNRGQCTWLSKTQRRILAQRFDADADANAGADADARADARADAQTAAPQAAAAAAAQAAHAPPPPRRLGGAKQARAAREYAASRFGGTAPTKANAPTLGRQLGGGRGFLPREAAHAAAAAAVASAHLRGLPLLRPNGAGHADRNAGAFPGDAARVAEPDGTHVCRLCGLGGLQKAGATHHEKACARCVELTVEKLASAQDPRVFVPRRGTGSARRWRSTRPWWAGGVARACSGLPGSV